MLNVKAILHLSALFIDDLNGAEDVNVYNREHSD